jgi:GNAT superfamily N-acetyltransferase
MSRKLRPLTRGDFEKLMQGCNACVFWESPEPHERRCCSVSDAELQAEWYDRVVGEWGDCGKAAYDESGMLGFIKYAPSRYFPQVRTFPSAPTDGDVPLIACMHVAPEARHRGLGSVLLRACLRDLAVRGERKVEAFATVRRPAVLEDSPMLGIDFLLRNGFTVARPDPDYPLLQLELRSLALITENLEAVLESLKIPLRMPDRSPAPW